jgi:hypothetical protein
MMSPDYAADHRERLARLRAEAAQRREEELVQQRSMLNTPDARVRIWERVHHLALPNDPQHPVLRVIAQQTSLHIDDVLEVQRERGARRVVTVEV